MSKSPAQTNIEVFLAIRKKLEIIIRAEGWEKEKKEWVTIEKH